MTSKLINDTYSITCVLNNNDMTIAIENKTNGNIFIKRITEIEFPRFQQEHLHSLFMNTDNDTCKITLVNNNSLKIVIQCKTCVVNEHIFIADSIFPQLIK